MNLLHLKYAIEVAKTGSITQAAENLFMGQPNLSKAIRELESNLGIRVFKRTPKGVVATKAGEEFLTHARSIISQINEIESLYKPGNDSHIALNISSAKASYISKAFAKLINSLDKTKDMEVNFKESASMDTIKNLLSGECTIGIIRYRTIYEKYFLNFLSEKDIKFETIWEFDCMAIMSEKHPLSVYTEVPYDDLLAYTEVVYDDYAVPFLSLASLRKLEKLRQPRRRLYINERATQLEFLTQSPDAYTMNSPLPDSILQQYSLVQKRCLQANYGAKDLLIYPKGYKLNEYEKKFFSELKNVKDNILSEAAVL